MTFETINAGFTVCQQCISRAGKTDVCDCKMSINDGKQHGYPHYNAVLQCTSLLVFALSKTCHEMFWCYIVLF